MSASNPFAKAIVADAWDAGVPDVAAIHASGYDVCSLALSSVREAGATQSVLIHGEPGSGKTHLLARLRAHWIKLVKNEDDCIEPQAVFSAIRLRSGGRMICRHLRRVLVNDLLRRRADGLTQLDYLLIHRAKRHLRPRNGARKWWKRLRLPDRAAKAEEDANELFRRFDGDFRLGRNLSRALCGLALGRYQRDLEEWLREGVLPDEVLQEVGLVPMPEEADPEEEALELICALSRLADGQLPLVLCFDQVEALQTHSRDREGLFAFGRMISALHDRLQHSLLVTCVQTSFLDTLREAIRAADLDRLQQSHAILSRLSVDQAAEIIAARLQDVSELSDQQSSPTDSLWPLSREDVRKFVQTSKTGGCTPRQLIAWCRERFDQWRFEQPSATVPVTEFLADRYEQERERTHPAANETYINEVLAHGLPLAFELLGHPRLLSRMEDRDIDLVEDSPGAGRRRVSFCNSAGNRLTGQLKRLREDVERNGANGLVLLRDDHLPISPNARRAREHLDALQQHGVPLLRLPRAAIATLDALRALLSDAKAGDLSHNGNTIEPQTVAEWLETHLDQELRSFLHQVSGGSSPEADPLYDALLTELQEERVALLDELARRITCGNDELLTCAGRHIDSVGVLRGPPTVLFERVSR